MRKFSWHYVLFCVLLSPLSREAEGLDGDCLNHAKAIFEDQEDSTSVLCGSVNKTLQCVDESFLQSTFGVPVIRLTSELCDDDLLYRFLTQRKCVRDRGFRLISCVANAWNMEHSKSEISPSLLFCKRFQQIQKCPEEILSPCGSKSVKVMEDVFQVLFNKIMQISCDGFSNQNLSELKVKQPFGNKYKKMAACLDANQAEVDACLMKSTDDINRYGLQKYFCKRYNDVETCLKNNIKDCPVFPEASDFFTAVFSLFGGFQCQDSLLDAIEEPSFSTDTMDDNPFEEIVFEPSSDIKEFTMSRSLSKILAMSTEMLHRDPDDYKSRTKQSLITFPSSSGGNFASHESNTVNDNKGNQIKSSGERTTDYCITTLGFLMLLNFVFIM